MSNERNGDIIPDSKRREAIGALGKDMYLFWTNGITGAGEVTVKNQAEIGDDTINLTGIALIGKLYEGQFIVISNTGGSDRYRVVETTATASQNDLFGVKLEPSIRKTTPAGRSVTIHPIPVWKTSDDILANGFGANISTEYKKW